jgi:hypothetical protein
MPRPTALLAALLGLLTASGAMAQSGGAPHSWLFGTWTGGLFPVPSGMTEQACLAQPTFIVTRDVVMRASITDITFAQRLVETVRNGPGGTDFRFVQGSDPVAGISRGLLGLEAPKPTPGFGCENPDVLRVQRRSENEIVFPGCTDFPNPLVRCGAR